MEGYELAFFGVFVGLTRHTVFYGKVLPCGDDAHLLRSIHSKSIRMYQLCKRVLRIIHIFRLLCWYMVPSNIHNRKGVHYGNPQSVTYRTHAYTLPGRLRHPDIVSECCTFTCYTRTD